MQGFSRKPFSNGFPLCFSVVARIRREVPTLPRGLIELRTSDFSPAEPLTLATVLVVSPDPDLAQGLALSLLDEPYEIHVCSSIAEATAHISVGTVDVVLLDQHLQQAFEGDLFAFLRHKRPTVIRILLGREEALGKAQRTVQNGVAHHCVPAKFDQVDLALLLYNTLVQRSFLPPESEGVLPISSSRPPASDVHSSRIPGAS